MHGWRCAGRVATRSAVCPWGRHLYRLKGQFEIGIPPIYFSAGDGGRLPLQSVIHINMLEFLAVHGTQLMKKHFYVQLIIQVSRRFVRAVPNMASSSNSESLIAKLVASLRYLREATVDIFGNIGVQDSYVSPLGEILLLYRSPKWLHGLENAGRGASKSGSTFKFGRTVT